MLPEIAAIVQAHATGPALINRFYGRWKSGLVRDEGLSRRVAGREHDKTARSVRSCTLAIQMTKTHSIVRWVLTEARSAIGFIDPRLPLSPLATPSCPVLGGHLGRAGVRLVAGRFGRRDPSRCRDRPGVVGHLARVRAPFSRSAGPIATVRVTPRREIRRRRRFPYRASSVPHEIRRP
jgi:hypothetical protein